MTKKNLLLRIDVSLFLICLLVFQICCVFNFFEVVESMKHAVKLSEAQLNYGEIRENYINVLSTWLAVLISAVTNFVAILCLVIPLFYGKLKEQAKATVVKMKEDAERNKEKRKQKEIEDKKSQIESLKKQIEEMERTE